jgi:hypothetical protein
LQFRNHLVFDTYLCHLISQAFIQGFHMILVGFCQDL